MVLKREDGLGIEEPDSVGAEPEERMSSNDQDDEEEEDTDVPEILFCVVCMDAQKKTLFQPCGHLVCCESCAVMVDACPMCRKPIEGRIEVFGLAS